MSWLRNLAVMAVALVLSNSADAAKAKKAKPIKGEVTEVKKDADKESGTIVVKIAANEKKGTPESTKTFKVSETTTVEKIAGKKAKGEAGTPAKFGDVQTGDNIVVVAKDDQVSTIKVLPKKKKAK